MSYDEPQEYEPQKFVVIGDYGTGKSALTQRFKFGRFDSKQIQSTVGGCHYEHQISMMDCDLKIQIWDTSGQERYRSIVPIYFRGAEGVIIIYDITNHDTFRSVDHWLALVKTHLTFEDLVVYLVGTKVDLEHQRVVPMKRALHYAQTHDLKYMETSAKIGYNVNELFCMMALDIDRKRPKGGIYRSAGSGSTRVIETGSRAGLGGGSKKWCQLL